MINALLVVTVTVFTIGIIPLFQDVALGQQYKVFGPSSKTLWIDCTKKHNRKACTLFYQRHYLLPSLEKELQRFALYRKSPVVVIPIPQPDPPPYIREFLKDRVRARKFLGTNGPAFGDPTPQPNIPVSVQLKATIKLRERLTKALDRHIATLKSQSR